jgi:hypothetical protein
MQLDLPPNKPMKLTDAGDNMLSIDLIRDNSGRSGARPAAEPER